MANKVTPPELATLFQNFIQSHVDSGTSMEEVIRAVNIAVREVHKVSRSQTKGSDRGE